MLLWVLVGDVWNDCDDDGAMWDDDGIVVKSGRIAFGVIEMESGGMPIWLSTSLSDRSVWITLTWLTCD